MIFFPSSRKYVRQDNDTRTGKFITKCTICSKYAVHEDTEMLEKTLRAETIAYLKNLNGSTPKILRKERLKIVISRKKLSTSQFSDTVKIMAKNLSSRIFSLTLLCLCLLILSSHSAFAQSVKSIGNGNTLLCPHLPSNFDPSHVSAKEVEQSLLPPLPTDPQQRADWVNRMKQVKHITCASNLTGTGHSLSKLPIIRVSKKQKTSAAFDTWTTGAWSGYLDKDTGGIDDIKGNWNTQCPSGNTSGTREGTWVGIGGINGQLVQTGTFYGHDHAYHFFTEFTPNPPLQDWSIGYGCGIGIYAEVYEVTTYQYWCTFVEIADGSNSYGTCYSSSMQPDWSTGEWVDERPNCTNGTSLLTDFNFTDFSNTYALSPTRGWHTIGGFENHALQMQNNPLSDNTILATPNPLNTGDTSFRDVWKNAGNGVSCSNL